MAEPPILHFLVTRGPEGLERIEVFRDGERALDAYTQREHVIRTFFHGRGKEVCLFGADSLLSLCRTHPSWLAPETIPEVFE
jgi:hypothetical protein